MYFTKMMIADPLEKKAVYQEFSKGFNVITGRENHIGKSSIVKSLFYALGTEVKFSDDWEKDTKLYFVGFCVDRNEYTIVRWHKNYIVLNGRSIICATNRVGSGLAPLFADIFSFSVHLANKKSKLLELAPPAFTFLPYYIDQDEGWKDMYNSFENITQYNKDDRLLCLYYHLNIYNKKTLQMMLDRSKLKELLDVNKVEQERLQITIDNLNAETNNLLPGNSFDDIEQSLRIHKEKIECYVKKLGDLRNKIQSLEVILEKNRYNRELVKKVKSHKRNDDKNEEVISFRCPNCGCYIEDNIFKLVMTNYSEQNKDYINSQFKFIDKAINDDLLKYKKEYIEATEILRDYENIYRLNNDNYKTYLRQRGLQETLEKLNIKRYQFIDEEKKMKQEYSKLRKELNSIISIEEVEDDYKWFARQNLQRLGVWEEKYSEKLRLLKPVKGQGAQVNKIILAQYVALFKTIAKYRKGQIVFPFVVDSPKTNEPSESSSKEIIDMIFSVDVLPQVILATTDFERSHPEFCNHEVNIIRLHNQWHLLQESVYVQYEGFINQFLGLFVNNDLFKR